MTGLVFDIKEFALNDGDGIRTTVFLKGCPLRCRWCHNPEGLSPKRELYLKQKGCLDCGLCRIGCNHPECQGLGRCLHICPKNLVGVAGIEWKSEALADHLLKKTDIYNKTNGGVTLSGGEPLLQHEFSFALLTALREKVNTAMETSGYAEELIFRRIAALCDHVFMDIKLADSEEHRKYTGVGNETIRKNAEWLKQSGIAHTFRTPLIPGITDTEDNLFKIKEIVGNSNWEKLPYNTLAGAKYKNVGREYTLADIIKLG